MLIPNLDLSHHSYTIRPWVKTGLPLALPCTNASDSRLLNNGRDAHSRVQPNEAPLDKISVNIIRSADPCTQPDFDNHESHRQSPSPLRDAFTPPTLHSSRPSPREGTPITHWSRTALFGPRDKTLSPKTPPTIHIRGKTVPTTTPSPRTLERSSDSAVSFTPITSSRHIANWFSGLLGR